MFVIVVVAGSNTMSPIATDAAIVANTVNVPWPLRHDTRLLSFLLDGALLPEYWSCLSFLFDIVLDCDTI
jgi:hypothetical protein